MRTKVSLSWLESVEPGLSLLALLVEAENFVEHLLTFFRLLNLLIVDGLNKYLCRTFPGSVDFTKLVQHYEQLKKTVYTIHTIYSAVITGYCANLTYFTTPLPYRVHAWNWTMIQLQAHLTSSPGTPNKHQDQKHIWRYIHICIYTLYIHMCKYIYICVDMYIWYIRIYIYIYIYINSSIYDVYIYDMIYTSIYYIYITHIYIYDIHHTHIYIYAYIYIYIICLINKWYKLYIDMMYDIYVYIYIYIYIWYNVLVAQPTQQRHSGASRIFRSWAKVKLQHSFMLTQLWIGHALCLWL